MNPDDPQDDPTRALDDFVLRMRSPAAPPQAAPDLSDLGARLHPAPGPQAGRSGDNPPASTRGGVLRSGQRWSADEVEDVPVVELPRQRPAPTDIPELSLPAVDLQAEARRAAQPAWQPEPQALRVRPQHNPRVLAQWQPGAWTAAVRQVLEGSTEFVTTAQGPVVETYPPQHLLLLWPPQRLDAPLLGRWPQQVRLWASDEAAAPAAAAAEALLSTLPDDARLWLQPDADAVDWALAAEVLLTHEPGLRPFQLDGLRAFISAEREASFARLNDAYHRPETGGARLRPPAA